MRKIFLLAFLFSLSTVAQVKDSVNLDNPNATIYTHIYYLQQDSYQPEKSAKTIYGLSEKEAIATAIKIKRVLDGKGLQIDFNKIPNNPDYNDTIGYSKFYKYVLFPERMPLISVEKRGNYWYYSAETVDKIDMLYEAVFPWYIDRIQEVIPGYGHKKFLGVEVWQYAALIVLLLLTILIYYIARRIAFFILQRILYRFIKEHAPSINKALKKLAHPISLLVALALVDKIFPSLQFSLEVNKWFLLSINIAATVFWIYVFLKLAKVLVILYEAFTETTDSKLDDQLVPILGNFLTGLIVVVGVLKIITLFGVNPTAVIAGASIGGLAIAFASQDTVKNLIGTVMIFTDKPFHIGDWVQAGEVVGTVEEVGFRSTRVRAADTSIYQIPNSKLSEMVINNSGLRLYRRYNTQLGIRYDTPPELIEAFVKGVREIILAHPDTKSDNYIVEFNGFGDSALLIMMNMYLKDLAWATEQKSRHQIHMAIVKLAKELGVDFAFPSTTVMIEQFPEKNAIDLKYNTDSARIDTVLEQQIANFKTNIGDASKE
ncbi:mechanosensitive ion channel family protein [Flavobacteriaceae bacterium S356]|uniref:Mechanosensitive ion channel family protein n=1 Tax=Asprobacillus argus TaxID=3076534 RepID=A0ABU3LFH1_9FLAO|nr:mechanosensitive ion channel family protein [Flavobacteriaceae bacterium S356]